MKWKADEYATSKLTGRLRHIEARRLFSLEEIKEKGESLADYGLDRSALTITVESKSGKVKLAFGSPTRDGRERYVMPDFDESEKTEIWAVNASLWDTANISAAEWMEREFLKFPVYDVRAFGIRIKRGDTLVKTRIMRETARCMEHHLPHSSPCRHRHRSTILKPAHLVKSHTFRDRSSRDKKPILSVGLARLPNIFRG